MMWRNVHAAAVQHPGALEAFGIARQAAGDEHARRQGRVQRAHQGRSIDADTVRQHEDRAQGLAPRVGSAPQPDAHRPLVSAGAESKARNAQSRVLELRHGDADAVVMNGIAGKFRTSSSPSPRTAGKLAPSCLARCVGRRRGCKGQHPGGSPIQIGWQRCRPRPRLMLHGLNSHEEIREAGSHRWSRFHSGPGAAGHRRC